jgi:hypothetical protein
MARQHKAQRDCGIEMRATEMAGSVDHRRHHQTKDEPHADMRDLTAGDGVNHDGPAASENEGKGPDPFGDAGWEERR